MTVSEILKLIEGVAPDDMVVLDEIDARVCCLVRGRVFVGMDGSSGGKRLHYKYESADPKVSKYGVAFGLNSILYTRSRDALKSIRPEGWVLSLQGIDHNWFCEMSLVNGTFMTVEMPCATEELAELHAVLQAIEYSRKNSS